ncbi:MAG: translation initiation factor IF-2 N-terminal domain-containing protein [bacterium]
MRVYELADELDQSSQELLRLLNNELDKDVNSHMNSLDETTARKIRLEYASGPKAVFTNFTGILTDSEHVKTIIGDLLDRAAYGVGIGLLLWSNKGDETRDKIREEIRDLGREITDPIKVGAEEIIDLASVIPSQLGSVKNQALENGVGQISPYVKGAFDEAKHLVESSQMPNFITNGEASPRKLNPDGK